MKNKQASRKTAITVGILFIIATVFLFFGQYFYGPILDSPQYLEIAYPNRITVVLGILLEFACTVSIPLIPIFLYPVLKKYNEPLALGYVGFRFFESILFFLTQIDKLSLIDVSRGYIESGGTDTYFVDLGSFLQNRYLWLFSFYLLVFTIGGLMFYGVLYKSKLIPRWISAWGFAAAALLLVGSILKMMGVEIGLVGAGFELVFATPIAVQEMVMAIWFIAKGFNS